MAAPRVFLSSTAYDLELLRGQLRNSITSLGYEAVLSEYSDILWDPRLHAQESCLKEIPTCDMVVLVVGSRFGSDANPAVLAQIDFDALAKASTNPEMLVADDRRISVTQLELLQAVSDGVPVFAFVDERVLQDHATFRANRDKDFIDRVTFSSLSQPELARYVFSFIDFLGSRLVNNSITPFARIEEVETHLKRQWAALFQRLLSESKLSSQESRRIDSISEQLDDLKVAVLSTIGDANSREVARGTVRYRGLLSIVTSMAPTDLRGLVEEAAPWEVVLERAGVVAVHVEPEDESPRQRSRVVLEKADETYYRGRVAYQRFERLGEEWSAFLRLNQSVRLAIFDGLQESEQMFGSDFFPAKYERDPFDGSLMKPYEKPDPVYGDEEPF